VFAASVNKFTFDKLKIPHSRRARWNFSLPMQPADEKKLSFDSALQPPLKWLF